MKQTIKTRLSVVPFVFLPQVEYGQPHRPCAGQVLARLGTQEDRDFAPDRVSDQQPDSQGHREGNGVAQDARRWDPRPRRHAQARAQIRALHAPSRVPLAPRHPRDHAGPGTRRTLARSSPHDPSGCFAVGVRPADIPNHGQLVRAGAGAGTLTCVCMFAYSQIQCAMVNCHFDIQI